MTTTIPFEHVLVVHGFGATPDDHWFPWLTGATGAQRLTLPSPTSPAAGTWVPLVTEALVGRGPETAVVAHSLGAVTVAQALLRRGDAAASIGRLVAVAPFAEPLPPTGEPDLDAFLADGLDAFVDLDLPVVAGAVRRVDVVRSDDDPIVQVGASDAFARALDATVHVVPGAGHFLAEDGVDRLDLVVDLLADR